MSKLKWVAAAGLALNAIIVAGLYAPGAPAAPAFWLSFVIAFGCGAPVFYIVNGRRFGRIDPADLWELLRELPVVARILLGALLAATVVQTYLSFSTVRTELGFRQLSALTGVWLCSVATALITAHERRLRRATPLPSTMVGSRRTLFRAIFGAVGLIIVAVMFVAQRDPIFDEAGTHERLSIAFGQSSWYPHLVAANSYHNAFIVYLDTRDPAVLTAACSDLVPEAANLNRRPDLYYAASGHATFIQECA